MHYSEQAVAVAADVHLDANKPQTLRAFEYIVDYCSTNGIKHLAIAGDLWHLRKSIPTDPAAQLTHLLRKAHTAGISVYLDPGNHDYTADTPTARHSMEVYSHREDITVAQRPYTTVPLADGSPFRLVVMPFEPDAKKLKDTLKDLSGDQADTTIIIGHQLVRGTILQGIKDKDAPVQATWYKPFHRVYMGDIHDRQKVGNVQYVGATIQHDFGDVGKDRGFVAYDPVTAKETWVTIPGAPIYHIYERTAADIGRDREGIRDLILRETQPGDYVSLRVSGTEAEMIAARIGDFRTELMEAKELRVVNRPTIIASVTDRIEVPAESMADAEKLIESYVENSDTQLNKDWLLKIGKYLLGEAQKAEQEATPQNITPLSLTGYNFGSFKYFKFMIEQGITSVTGVNKDEGGSNGSGKSTFLNAWLVLLFGESEQDIVSDDYINWDSTDPYTLNGELRSTTGDVYQITRSKEFGKSAKASFSKNSVEEANSVPDVNRKVRELLRMDRELFQYIVFMTQEGKQSFADATDAKRRELLTKVLPYVTTLDDALKLTKKAVKDGETKESELKISIAAKQSEIDTLKTTDYVLLQEQFEANRAQDVTRMQGELGTAVRAYEQAKIDVEAAKETLEQARSAVDYTQKKSELNAIIAKRAAVEDGRNKWVQHKAQLNAARQQIESSIAQAESAITDFQRPSSGTQAPATVKCDKCLQPITPEAVYNYTLVRTQEVTDLRINHADVLEKITAADTSIAKYDEWVAAIQQASADLNQVQLAEQNQDHALRNIQQVVDQLTNMVTIRQGDIQRAEANLTAKKSEKNPYDDLIDQQKQKIAAAESALVDLTTQLQQAQNILVGMNYWVEAFGPKGVRTFMFDGFVVGLSNTANSVISMLMDGVYISLESTKTTQAGDVRENLNFLIWKDGRQCTMQRFSGGEQRMIKLAINIAVSFVAQERMQTSFGMLIMDESFNNLDGVRIQRVASALTHIQQKVPSIYLVSHMESLQDMLTNTITVVKEHGESSLTYKKAA